MTTAEAGGFRLAPQEFDPAIPISEIREHPKNVNEGDVGAIDSSMRAHGMAGGILVQRSTGYIISGNHTYRTAVGQGAEALPGFWVDVDDDEAVRMMLDWNHSGRLGRDDPYKAAEVLIELAGRDALPATYTRDDVDDILAQIDEGTGLFPDAGDDLPTEHECPRCHYKWSGKATARAG